MATSTLTSKGQTTIPKEIRERLGLKPGDKIDFVTGPDGQVVIRPRTLHVRDLYGILKPGTGKVVSLEEMDEAIAGGATGTLK